MKIQDTLLGTIKKGPWGGPYTPERAEVRTTDVPRSGQTQSGYGKRLPTQYMIKRGTRWHRVYCVCYSNIGTLYIRTKDVTQGIVVDIYYA